MPEITEDARLTLINTFTVRPENCDALLDALARATDEVMSNKDGFISASFHRGLDGDRVVNYAQWRDRAAFEAMLTDPDARAHMAACGNLAVSFDPQFYEVVSVHG